jgi:hypothetical protein
MLEVVPWAKMSLVPVKTAAVSAILVNMIVRVNEGLEGLVLVGGTRQEEQEM